MNDTIAPPPPAPTWSRRDIDLMRAGYVARIQEFSRSAAEAKRQAALAFPYPKVTRPRVAKAFGFEYRMENGRMMHRLAGSTDPWLPRGFSTEEFARGYRTLLDLIDNPTEEVEG